MVNTLKLLPRLKSVAADAPDVIQRMMSLSVARNRAQVVQDRVKATQDRAIDSNKDALTWTSLTL